MLRQSIAFYKQIVMQTKLNNTVSFKVLYICPHCHGSFTGNNGYMQCKLSNWSVLDDLADYRNLITISVPLYLIGKPQQTRSLQKFIAAASWMMSLELSISFGGQSHSIFYNAIRAVIEQSSSWDRRVGREKEGESKRERERASFLTNNIHPPSGFSIMFHRSQAIYRMSLWVRYFVTRLAHGTKLNEKWTLAYIGVLFLICYVNLQLGMK